MKGLHRKQLAVAALLAGLTPPLLAHPLGNDSITHFNVLYVLPDRLEVDYLLDIAETPTTFIESAEMDADKNGEVDQAEQQAWLDGKIAPLAAYLNARLDGTDLPLTLVPEQEDRASGRKTTTSKIIVPMLGPMGMTYRVVIRYVARYPKPLEQGEHVLRYEDKTYAQNSGLKLVLLEPSELCQAEITLPPTTSAQPIPPTLLDGLTECGIDLQDSHAQLEPAPPTRRGESRWRLDAGEIQLALIQRASQLSVCLSPYCEILDPHPAFVAPDNSVFRYEQYDPMNLPDIRTATVKFTLFDPGQAASAPAQTAALPASQPAGIAAHALPPHAGQFLDPAYNPLQQSNYQQQAQRMIDLLKGRWGFALFLIVTGTAFIWGAAHALMPGHAKTVVAAYLISQHGTYWHAAVLAMIVTVTHTALVVILGVVIWVYQRSHPRLGPTLQLWLGLIAGLLVAGMGVMLAWRALTGRMAHEHAHDHDHADTDDRSWLRKLFTHSHPHVPGHTHEHAHDLGHSHEHGHVHDHEHPHAHAHEHAHTQHAHGRAALSGPSGAGAPLTFRMLLVLGITGGIVPCPTATIIMLLGIGANVVAGALYAIAIFSLGLALTLMVIGSLALTSRRYAARVLSDAADEGQLSSPGKRLLLQVIPGLSGLVVTLLGIMIATAYACRMYGVIPPRPFSWFG